MLSHTLARSVPQSKASVQKPLAARGSRRVLRHAANAAPQSSSADRLGYKHLLLTILDANSFLSDGSKQGVATASQIASITNGKVTVLIVDEEGTTSSNPTERLDSLNWHFNDAGFQNYQILEKDIKTPASVLIGDVADEIQADLVLLSTEAVHAKHVDANQLAEFVSCPLLLLP